MTSGPPLRDRVYPFLPHEDETLREFFGKYSIIDGFMGAAEAYELKELSQDTFESATDTFGFALHGDFQSAWLIKRKDGFEVGVGSEVVDQVKVLSTLSEALKVSAPIFDSIYGEILAGLEE
jgi:hypothetical protein